MNQRFPNNISRTLHLAVLAALIALGGGLGLGLSAATAASVTAHEYDQRDIHIAHPFARASIGRGDVGAAYMVFDNRGTADDRLVSASSPVADRTELHGHEMKDGVMRMFRIDGGIALPAGTTVPFKPAGLHIMLLGLKHKLVEGEQFPLTLDFEHAGSVTVSVHVESPTAGADGHMDHMKMHHDQMHDDSMQDDMHHDAD